MAKVELEFREQSVAQALYGQQNANLKMVESELDVALSCRGNVVVLGGAEHAVALGQNLLMQLYEVARQGYPIYPVDVGQAIRLLRKDSRLLLRDYFLDTVFVSASKRVIVPKTFNQKQYIETIRGQDIVFGVGPAGTGKTYLAMAMALAALLRHQVKRIVLVRPAVEAGEKLGFLPGDMAEKVNPYLRPLHDALFDMMDLEKAGKLLQQGTIEVAPLAFMRGRTLNSAFVILDEAQNATREQMKMFLTRLGFDSKAVITGDLTQTDLPDAARSGLRHALRILAGVEGIGFVQFTDVDVVRHPLVQKIIQAYEREDLAAAARAKADNGEEPVGGEHART